jgi:hypothetical protein
MDALETLVFAAIFDRTLMAHTVKKKMWIGNTAVSVRPVENYKIICSLSKNCRIFSIHKKNTEMQANPY